MPNRSEHIKTGALVGGGLAAAIDVFKQLDLMDQGEQEEFNWLQLLGKTVIGTGIGAVLGNLPDMLEPATSPNHRKFFHSLAFTLSLTVGTAKVVRNTEINSDIKEITAISYVSILSHLFLDSQTPRGLPLV